MAAQVLELSRDEPAEVLGAVLKESTEGPVLHILLQQSLLTYKL